jgi:photosystem II stability/assembly factor-like uncharacterized protein
MVRRCCLVVRLFALSLMVFSFAGLSPAQDPDAAPQSGAPKNFEGGDFVRQRMDWEYKQRAYPHKRIPMGARLRALKEYEAKLAREAAARTQAGNAGLSNPAWIMIGPEPENNVFWGPNSGRVAAIAIDPTNTNTVFAAAAQGGVWKTTDAGTTWTPLTDQQASLASGSIVIDPNNHLNIYVGTGEDNNSGDSYYGAGVLKSTDGGNTWTQLCGLGQFCGGAYGGGRIGGLAIQPSNSQVILAAMGCCGITDAGIYRTTDGGNTWTQVLDVNGQNAYNVIFDPTNTANAYADIDGNGVYKSTNGGVSWTAINSGLPTSGIGRIALAMDPNNSSILYAGIADNNTNSLYGLYKTTNGGSTWTQITNAPNYCGGQCWYDNTIAVQPGNSSVIFVGGDGGTPLARSLDGGTSWTTYQNIHPDLHALQFTPNGSTLFIGNDGGMYSSSAPAASTLTFNNLNSGLATLQFYSGASINPNNANMGFGGTQDNLTNEYNDSLGWQDVDCGDGGQTAIDFTNTNNVYVNCVGMTLDKSTNGGASFTSSLTGINTSDPVNWVPPLVMDPNSAQRLYFGTNHVYQTTNGASLWTSISPDLTTGNGNQLVALAVAPTDSNTVYAGSTDVRLHVTRNALSGSSATWTDISNSTSLPNRSITSIAVDPHNASTAYVTFSGFSGYGDNLGHVVMTTNAGSTWTDISSDLPNIPVNGIVVDPISSGYIYVGTDFGAFYTSNTGGSWSTLGTGLPRVAVYGLSYQSASHILWAVTHGRSVWSLDTSSLAGLPEITALSPSSVTAGASQFTLTVTGSAFVSGAQVQWNGTGLTTTFVNSTSLTATVPAGDVANAGTATVTVLSGGVTSNPFTFTINNPVPTATSLSPSSATAGGAGFTLTVNGTNFVSTSSVLWNGSSRTTSFVSSTQLNATINAADIANGGTANVSVSNPAPGGGASNTLTFTINNPVPALTSLSPSSKTEGAASFTLTVNGTSFVNGATINWNGTPLATTFKSNIKLTTTVPASDVATAGTFPVTVTNPTPGGGTSGSLTFTVNNPKPTISSLSPSSKTAGAAGFTLTVNGTNYVSTSTVNWAGSARTTTYVSSTKVTATINAADVATAGTFKVTVTNPSPGGGTSSSSNFTVNNPVPTLSSISPTTVTTGSGSFTLTATGTNYVSGSHIQWNGNNLTTTYVSSTSLTATVPASDITSAGTASVTVNNGTPGGGTSGSKTININNGVPTITSLSPSSATAGAAQLTMTVNGTNFVSTSVVNWNGVALSTSFTSATKVTATVPTSDLANAGTFSVTVTNPAPGGGTSSAATFTVNNPKPTITSLSPSSTTAGGTSFTLTVNGTNFVSTSTVNWAGSARTTTFVSATQVNATINAADITTAGTFKITVTNPTPGGGTSSSSNFTVNNPVPTLTSISPSSATHGGASFTLTATGTNFVSGAHIQWKGTNLTTTFVSSTSLTATVPSSDITNAGTASVTVNNPTPGGGTSNSQTFTIN